MQAKIWHSEVYPDKEVAEEVAEEFMKCDEILGNLGFSLDADIHPHETWTEVIFSIEV